MIEENKSQPTQNQVVHTPSMVDLFASERRPDEVDLVGVVYSLLKHYYSDGAASSFISSYPIPIIIGKGSLQQRVIINRYFSILLLRWRASHPEFPIHDTLIFLHNDGTHSEWIRHFANFVLPFLKINLILGD